jgi:exodeoxyribonuclease VII large subunit
VTLETSPETPASVRVIADRLADYINRLGAVWVEGQVAQFRPRPGASFQYFTLRDLEADMSLNVMIPTGKLAVIQSPLEPGQRVIVQAKPNFWTRNGSLTMRASDVRAVGLGDLLAQLARLKEALAAEGLFAAERKQPLPFLPQRIGLICGRASDAMHDVMVNAQKRWPGIEFEVREVPVQGSEAASSVIAALRELDSIADVDVIVITRGGGSMEDLLPFSAEALVRAAAEASTPIVSAIGHEQDAPLLDYVADLRASTPTDAAKRIVPSFVEQDAIVRDLRSRAHRAVSGALMRASETTGEHRDRIRNAMAFTLEHHTSNLEHVRARLRTLSPQATLDRGYAIALLADGTIIRSADTVRVGDAVDIRVADGRFWTIRTDEESHHDR